MAVPNEPAAVCEGMDGAAAARDVGDIEQVTRGGSGGRRRAVTVAFAGMGLLVLVACAAGGGWGSPGATSLAASSGNLGTPDRWVPGGALRGKALAAVKRMYAANPEFVKEFASLTGRGGNALLNELKGPAVGSSAGVKQRQQQLVQPVIPPDAILGEDMQMLNFALAASDNSTDGAAQGEGGAEGAVEAEVDGGGAADPLALTDAESAEKARRARAFGTAEVNQRSAYMMVKGLSSDWDTHSNYSATPWEFCSGRNLSPRQIRVCAEHLIHAAGINAHRDLNLNAQIYDRFCAGDEHQWLDRRGSPITLPAGADQMCLKAVTARNNVDRLLKRQISLYKTHRDLQTGKEIPRKVEMEGSHSVDCADIPEGC